MIAHTLRYFIIISYSGERVQLKFAEISTIFHYFCDFFDYYAFFKVSPLHQLTASDCSVPDFLFFYTLQSLIPFCPSNTSVLR